MLALVALRTNVEMAAFVAVCTVVITGCIALIVGSSDEHYFFCSTCTQK